MDVKFGTSGLRGLASDLAAGPAFAHVFAFCRLLETAGHCGRGSRVFVARDRRASSPLLAAQTKAAIRMAGYVPADCGEVPTPALAHHAFKIGCAAIMVTGSHIPADRNGLKFYLPGAEIGKADEARIAALAVEAPPLPPLIEGLASDHSSAVMRKWRERHRGIFGSAFLSGMRIGVHEHSSVAAGFLADLLASFGADVFRFGRCGTFVPLDTEAVGSGIIAQYAAEAASRNLDAIVSTDADGDRPLFAGASGRPLPGDLLGWITSQWIGADAVATPVTSNSAIANTARIKVRRTRVGSPWVIAAMTEALGAGARVCAGFEANGGFLLANRCTIKGQALSALPTRDSVLPLLAILQYMRRTGLKAEQILPSQKFRAIASGRIADFDVTRSASLVAELAGNTEFAMQFLAPVGKPASCDAIDGLRFALEGGEVIHLRPSGNAPELRCYAEAATQARADTILEIGLALASRYRAA